MVDISSVSTEFPPFLMRVEIILSFYSDRKTLNANFLKVLSVAGETSTGFCYITAYIEKKTNKKSKRRYCRYLRK